MELIGIEAEKATPRQLFGGLLLAESLWHLRAISKVDVTFEVFSEILGKPRI